jgi:hypothetical protein
MKKFATLVLLVFFASSCKESGKNLEVENNTTEATKETLNSARKENINKALPSADYSSLLIDYECDMDFAEVAKVLAVAQSDLSTPEYKTPKDCSFILKGFGENSAGNGVRLLWNAYKSSKGQNKKEIRNYQKNQKELPEKVRLGMSIALAETKDCYIAQQPAHGRVIILNENYDAIFVLNYGRKGAFKRTEEQHNVLKEKMTDLANYLLKKHKK